MLDWYQSVFDHLCLYTQIKGVIQVKNRAKDYALVNISNTFLITIIKDKDKEGGYLWIKTDQQLPAP